MNTQWKPNIQWRPVLSGLCLFLIIAGCSSEDELRLTSNQNTAQIDGQIELSIPEQLFQTRAINRNNLWAEITVNGETTEWRNGSTFTGEFSVPEGDTLSLTINWYETFENKDKFQLASVTMSDIVITDNRVISITASDYQTQFDDDGDNASNLAERNAGSDPNNVNDFPGFVDTDGDTIGDDVDNCPVNANTDQLDFNNNTIGDVCDDSDQDNVFDAKDNCPNTANTDQADDDNNGIGNVCDIPIENINVRIKSISAENAPVIDGLYDSIWATSTFNDTLGEKLSIDNLMIDQGADRQDGNTEFQWAAMHDDTYLYLFVFGEGGNNQTPFRDSTGSWNDDNINIYLDGDNSKGSSYDGIDDYHLLIPLLSRAAIAADPTTTPPTLAQNGLPLTIFQGQNSATLPEIEFGTCLCSAEQATWEIKIPLAGVNIEINRPFGIDVQLDDDNDGGARDAKWGWFHPSRSSVGDGLTDADFTWTTPSYMGTAVLE